MSRNIYSGSVRIYLLFSICVLTCGACVRGAFQPVNTGREYGDPVPIMVSHIGKSNPHYILQNILCFDYACRKGHGRKKAMRAISFEDYRKRIRKNARKGAYKKQVIVPDVRQDTLKKVVKVSDQVTGVPPAPLMPQVLKADSLITLSELLFETNSYKLKTAHFSALDSLGKFLKDHPTLEVFVSGHTDNTGSELHNVTLSMRRAEAVADYLVNTGAVPEKVSFEGFGSSKPIRGNETEGGRSKNRRVEILMRNPRTR